MSFFVCFPIELEFEVFAKFTKSRAIALVILVFCSIQGCGNSNKAVLPTDALTEEQKAAIKAEDDRVNDEESQGSFGKSKAKKK